MKNPVCILKPENGEIVMIRQNGFSEPMGERLNKFLAWHRKKYRDEEIELCVSDTVGVKRVNEWLTVESRNKRAAQNRKDLSAVMRSLGMVQVKGPVSGRTYWE